MIDDKKIEEAAFVYIDNEGKGFEAFVDGAKWAINEFLKDLWHDAREVPKYDKYILVQYTHGGYYIVFWEEYNFSNQRNVWSLKITRWAYIDDLLQKKGGNHD